MSEARRTPKLRFPEFSGEWDSKALIDTVDKNIKWGFTGGPFGSDLKSVDYTESGVQIIQLQNIGDGVFINQHKIYTSDSKANALLSCNIYPNEILISKMGDPVARACLTPEGNDRYLMSSDGIRFIPDGESFDRNFIFFNINDTRFRRQAISLSTGSTRKRIGLTDLRKIKINIPTKPEQQKIAKFLIAVDSKIEQLVKKKELHGKYKKSLMQKIFSQAIRFKADDGSDYPDWEEKKLGGVLDYEQPTNYIVESTEYDDSFDTPVLTAGKSFILGYTNETHSIFHKLPVIIFDDFTTANKYVDFPFKVKSSAMKILKSKDNFINTKLVFEFIQMLHFPIGEHKRYWISEYQDLKIPFPSFGEQTKIATFLSSIDSKIEQIVKQLNETKQFKKALLQQMFV